MDKEGSSIENLVNTSNKHETSKNYEWGIREFNNVETADRKLIVNKKLEFWVHDDALATYSDFFAEIFGKSLVLNSTINVENTSYADEDYKKTDITVPHEHLFFDILVWIYGKDSKKLKKAAKTFQPFLYLISLGIYLKMKPEFFEILLTKPSFDWKIEYFSDPTWSKSIFTFPILERIVEQMKTDNFTKIIALVSWLKEINPVSKAVINTKESLEQILTSTDLFLVRNYVKRNSLMSGLSGREIGALLERFPQMLSAFDASTLVEEFIFTSMKKLVCLVCKKEFSSPFEIIESLECKGENFHPKNCINVKNDKAQCNHESCGRKLVKGENTCCHKQITANGCCSGEGKHMIVLSD